MSHSPEPWIEGCWERVQVGRKLYYEFHATPQDVCSETAVYSGVKDGDRVHCSQFHRGQAPGKLVLGIDGEYSDTRLFLSDEDLRRMLACVNLLADIPTDVLQRAKCRRDITGLCDYTISEEG